MRQEYLPITILSAFLGCGPSPAGSGATDAAPDSLIAPPDSGVDVARPDAGPGIDGGRLEVDAAVPQPAVDGDVERWDESASWRFFSRTLELPWAELGGDWLDATSTAQGETPFVTADIVDDDTPGPIEIDVTAVIADTGEADFMIRRRGGTNFVFHARESGGMGPVLLIDGMTIPAEADSSLNETTSRTLGELPTLASQGPMLIRFALPEGIAGANAVLRLESTGAEFGDQTLEVYATNAHIQRITRPAWLVEDTTELDRFTGADVLRNDLPVEEMDGVATAQLNAPALTWINSNKVIANRTRGCATVYQWLGEDFVPGQGGKLPGFSNTGDSVRGDDVVDGVSYPDSGWGGRAPDGIHWSARTGFGTWNDSWVAMHTYFYALEPHNSFGWVDPVGFPIPKGEWSAYVQCIQLNTVGADGGNDDGALYYELSGVGPIYSREGIRWRDVDAPESEIREFWINYYCGGTSCGDEANRGTVRFAAAVLTAGLPDMDAVAAEVERLNRERP